MEQSPWVLERYSGNENILSSGPITSPAAKLDCSSTVAHRSTRVNVAITTPLGYRRTAQERKEEYDLSTTNIRSNWFSYLSRYEMDSTLTLGLSDTYRAAVWGSTPIVSKAETELRRSVLEAFNITSTHRPNTIRHCINIGVWSLTSNLTLSVSMLAPALLTSTLCIPKEYQRSYERAVRRIAIELPSSNQTDRVSYKMLGATTIAVFGRLASSIVGAVEQDIMTSEPEFYAQCNYCHLGSTRLVFKIINRGKLKWYYFGRYTSLLIHSVANTKYKTTYDNEKGMSLFPYYTVKNINGATYDNPHIDIRANRSHLLLTTEGDVRYMGSPQYAKSAFSSMYEILYNVISDTSNMHQLLSSLVHF